MQRFPCDSHAFAGQNSSVWVRDTLVLKDHKRFYGSDMVTQGAFLLNIFGLELLWDFCGAATRPGLTPVSNVTAFIYEALSEVVHVMVEEL